MPGGVMVPIAEKHRLEIAKRIPELSLEALDRVGGMYVIDRDHQAERPTIIRENLQAIAEKAGALYVALATMREETSDALSEVLPDWQVVEDRARVLMGAARSARLDLDLGNGRPFGARRALVRNLAALLRENGLTADSRPNGELCFLTGVLLATYGEETAEPRNIVRKALVETPE